MHNTPNRFCQPQAHGNRRAFLARSAAGLAAAGFSALPEGYAAEAPAAAPAPARPLIAPNDIILFQGDSITDAGWNRAEADQANKQSALGSGYAWLTAAALLVDQPGDGLRIYNRGISGNKVFQLADRWQQDCLDLKPNVLSILIGVNDFWHTLGGGYTGTVEVYEHDYRALIERTRQAFAGIRLVLCEPFVLRCGAVNEKWFPAFDAYRGAARRVAESCNAVFVPFQAAFDRAIRFAPPEHWAGDGVHPSAAGAALMAHEWLKAVGGIRPA
jgi:lysophospholipase L1-like esterase